MFDRPDMSRDGWQDQIKMHVRNLAKDRGLFFEDEALELFVMLAGTDFAQIENELEKIDLFLSLSIVYSPPRYHLTYTSQSNIVVVLLLTTPIFLSYLYSHPKILKYHLGYVW